MGGKMYIDELIERLIHIQSKCGYIKVEVRNNAGDLNYVEDLEIRESVDKTTLLILS